MDRRISKADFEMVQKLEPATAMAMLRRRVQLLRFTNVQVKNWLRNHATGLYHLPFDDASIIMFELDDDLILFLTAFQGKTN